MKKRIVAVVAACLLAFSPAAGAAGEAVFPVSEQTWQFLDRSPAGKNHIVAYSLGGRPVRGEVRESALAGIENAVKNGFQSPTSLERAAVLLVKLGENPASYRRADLISQISGHANLYEEGLPAAYGALRAYAAYGGTVPDNARNSPGGAVDYIVSSQQRSGGFAVTTGRTPDVRATALAVMALAPYKDTAYVSSSLGKALDWLSAQQHESGAFPAEEPDCAATAAVLTALRSQGVGVDDSRFVKDGRTLLDAMDAFLNTDGGYRASLTPGPSEVEATEAAVIALYTDAFGLPPDLAPSAYPNYVEPEPDPKTSYLSFVLGFLGVFGVVYLLLLLTTWIGKKWGGCKIPLLEKLGPGSATPPEAKNDAAVHGKQDPTLELHIPMKAEMPEDFDDIYRKEHRMPGRDEPTED